MESRPRERWAPPGRPCLSSSHMAPGLLALLLLPWTRQLAGGQSVIHTGPPIVVSLTNTAVSFKCRITYRYTLLLQRFTVSYFLVDLQGQKRQNVPVDCQPRQGTENQTLRAECQVTPQLPNASATGTYYCSVHWPKVTITGNGTFILVRDTGYQPSPPGLQNTLLFCFLGLLVFLSILGTAALLWKKQHMESPGKPPAENSPAPHSTSCPEQSPVDSVYTEKLQNLEDDGEFNLVYENL
ncbi:NFAT activation molecule 1 isoform X2 [Erinaceus europaeus]|uniref:NFAT activation molecule 1 isoform X2 n=1 Tax=Erinaceus europaeus TaxID=9365 RepID=A0ABM3X899_ERIEU|nr:NFAT activation molecule 1 isoform X2 [Erinaceus europaeus]